MERSFIPYKADRQVESGTVLILAPHPDDEVFGCGGAIIRHVAAGDPVHVVIVTDGGFQGKDGAGNPNYSEVRRQESIAAAKVLSYGDPVFLGLPDRGIEYGEKLIFQISEEIGKYEPNLIYAPSIFEMHPDHRALGMSALEAVRRSEKTLKLAMYEVGVPLRPNLLLDISDIRKQKQKAMACFKSQLKIQNYAEHVQALNRFRTFTLPRTVTTAEAYMVSSSKDLSDDPFGIYSSEFDRQAKSGLKLDPGKAPLVTVIIRSIGREAYLREALDSVALQTYPNIEVLIVNAKGEGHPELGKWCGRFPLRMCGSGKPLLRSAAANLGLEHAKGEYLIFLDDDDLFDPYHVSNLVDTVKKSKKSLVAYSGIRCFADDNSDDLGTVFNSPYDPLQLLAGNFMPIHSVLFQRRLIDEGCKFDESLNLYEDWDFWIQLSQKTFFIHSDRITAAYRIDNESGFGVNADLNVAYRASLKIYKKWRVRWSEQQLSDLMKRVRDQRTSVSSAKFRSLEKHIVSLEKHIVSLEKHVVFLEDKEKSLKEKYKSLKEENRLLLHNFAKLEQKVIGEKLLKDEIEVLRAIEQSRLWRATKPLRNFLGWMRAPWLELKKINPKNSDKIKYEKWLQLYALLSEDDYFAIRERIKTLSYHPKISVILPVFNTPEKWLRRAIESVIGQIYLDWELCIADDASTKPHVRETLEEYSKIDSRIHVIYRARNGHISAASNSALDLAKGEFIALLDHDDEFSKHALYWVVEELNRYPEADIIYSDEDKIGDDGRRYAPHFKPSWNPELFLSQNYISHLGVYRTQCVKDVGGFREGYEGSQDYDLCLRCVAKTKPEKIRHIPHILYHWRAVPGSTARDTKEKKYAEGSAIKAIFDYISKIDPKIRVEAGNLPTTYRVRYPLPDILPLVSLIIPTWNGYEILKTCIESIRKKTTYPNYEILIVDNRSDDERTLKYLDELNNDDKINILKYNHPFNYSAINNMAVKATSGALIGLLNNDIEVISPDWLEEMVSHAVRPEIGVVGAKLYYANDTIQHAGVILGIGGIAGHLNKHLSRDVVGYFGRTHLIQNLSAVTGACCLVERSIYDGIGGLDEDHLRVAFNDIDFCLKVSEKGFRNLFTPYAEFYHHESASRGLEDTPEKVKRFQEEISFMKTRWGDQLIDDLAYNPNLSLLKEDFSLACPPRVERPWLSH